MREPQARACGFFIEQSTAENTESAEGKGAIKTAGDAGDAKGNDF
jgi:hypothetical protein